ncbi:hydrogenase maturation protease [Thermodesulfovibrionales bacterium]|nr:hydrogenase maturation protease [Thermodesulfovibrionales bacterium]
MAPLDLLSKVISKTERVLIVGLGNILREDDGVGIYVVNGLEKRGLQNFVIDAGTAPQNYIHRIRRSSLEVIILIDAVDFRGRPGEIIFEDIYKIDEIAPSTTTHKFPIKTFAQLIRGLVGDIEIYLLGIQPRRIGYDFNLSEDIKESGDDIINSLINSFSRPFLLTKKPLEPACKRQRNKLR